MGIKRAAVIIVRSKQAQWKANTVCVKKSKEMGWCFYDVQYWMYALTIEAYNIRWMKEMRAREHCKPPIDHILQSIDLIFRGNLRFDL